MIKQDDHLIVLNQTLAYKNSNLQFVDFTDNLLVVAGVKKEDTILGKRDDQDLPWSMYADEYHIHDRDALNGINYGAVVSFQGGDNVTQTVFCTRTKCELENKKIGIFIHVLPLVIPDMNNLVNLLKKTDPSTKYFNHYVGKNIANIRLTNKEEECLFYLIRGKTSKFIAKIMHISYRTVEFHIENLKVKFNCQNKSELICSAINQGYMSIIPKSVSATNMYIALK